MFPNTGVEANTADDLARIKTVRGGIGIELIEVRDAHGKVGIGEQLDRLRLGTFGKQNGDIGLQSRRPASKPAKQEARSDFSPTTIRDG